MLTGRVVIYSQPGTGWGCGCRTVGIAGRRGHQPLLAPALQPGQAPRQQLHPKSWGYLVKLSHFCHVGHSSLCFWCPIAQNRSSRNIGLTVSKSLPINDSN